MAPNADIPTLRNRFPNRTEEQGQGQGQEQGQEQNYSNDATVSTTPLKSIKGTEVVIDGIIYDLKSFEHPGGDSVLIFGGNDVTVQYKMIHPYHTEHHLKKMKVVGKLSKKETESE